MRSINCLRRSSRVDEADAVTKRLPGCTPASRMLPVLWWMPRTGVREMSNVFKMPSLTSVVSCEGTPSSSNL